MGDTIMAITINADTSNGLKLTSDTSGQIDFQSAGSTKALIDTSGNLKFNSGYGSVVTGFGVRSWVNFNGSGTVAIRASGNVSSITDNGTGNYTINITNDLANANGCMSGYSIMDGLCYGDNSNVSSAGSFRMRVVVGSSNSLMDPDEFHVQIVGDIA